MRIALIIILGITLSGCVSKLAGKNQKCGGFAGIACEEGLTCYIDVAGMVDGFGTCR